MTKTSKPNFFVVGAAKAGTTSIYHYLKHHSDIYLSPIKEPHFFSTDIKIKDFSSTYKKHTFLDLDSYFSQKPYQEMALSFVKDIEQYKKLFENHKQETAIGECSPSYLYSKKAAQNIFDFNKEAKIIISLRNPIKRAFSHYLMALRLGQTHLNFREAFEKDLNESIKGWGISELFYELGMYSAQIEKYLKIFPENNIKIVLFDDLANNNNELIKSIHEFLCVEQQDINEETKHNEAFVPKNAKFNKIITKSGVKNFISDIVNNELKDKLKSFIYNKDEIPELEITDKEYLRELYKNDILKTSKLIGKDLSFWLEG